MCKLSIISFSLIACAAPQKLPSRSEPNQLGIHAAKDGAGEEYRFCDPDGGPWGCAQPTPKTPISEPANINRSRDDDSYSERASQAESRDLAKPLSLPLATVYFPFDQSSLSNDAKDTIRQLIKSFDPPPSFIRIDGFTDSVGPESYNNNLALERAISVQEFFLSESDHEINIEANGTGDCCYVASNADEQSRAQNRRAVIRVGEEE